MWNSRKEFRDWIKSLDSSSIIANRILCEDKLGLFKTIPNPLECG